MTFLGYRLTYFVCVRDRDVTSSNPPLFRFSSLQPCFLNILLCFSFFNMIQKWFESRLVEIFHTGSCHASSFSIHPSSIMLEASHQEWEQCLIKSDSYHIWSYFYCHNQGLKLYRRSLPIWRPRNEKSWRLLPAHRIIRFLCGWISSRYLVKGPVTPSFSGVHTTCPIWFASAFFESTSLFDYTSTSGSSS